ncbi:hypothetical protein JG688_00007618 [Phytophthora aleatoria]|uniref:Uncharacterized protein n=1 Tax=Phytophthora aleatoria TaxID=2496075 RepID=A0A8J5IV97_9STRA|nr:hypothetical protein JG688_00007618 [Phytophthora aleatoria]
MHMNTGESRSKSFQQRKAIRKASECFAGAHRVYISIQKCLASDVMLLDTGATPMAPRPSQPSYPATNLKTFVGSGGLIDYRFVDSVNHTCLTACYHTFDGTASTEILPGRDNSLDAFLDAHIERHIAMQEVEICDEDARDHVKEGILKEREYRAQVVIPRLGIRIGNR